MSFAVSSAGVKTFNTVIIKLEENCVTEILDGDYS